VDQAVAWGDPGPRATVIARGPDAVRFIDGFTTAAVARLSVGEGVEGFFTDARGWVLALARILRSDDGVWIDAEGGLAARLHAHLEHYHIRERLELVDASAERAAIVVVGPAAETWLATRLATRLPERLLDHRHGQLGGIPVVLVRIDWYGPDGFLVQSAAGDRDRLIAWFGSEGLPHAAPRAFEAARIEAGSPEPADIPEKTLPQELGRDARAISFDKGCYLGQETVARIDAVGHVNRRLVAVAFDGPPDQDGTVEVRSGGEVVGRLTSTCFSPTLRRCLGIGLVHVKALDAARALEVLRRPAAVVTTPVTAADDPPSETGELLLETRRFSVVRVTQAGADGSREREVVRHPGSVVIVPLIHPQQVCLIEVVRVAVGKTLLELPAGTLDKVESLEEAARRELAEETGYHGGSMQPVGAFWMSPGILRERMHLFVAEGLSPGPQALEPGEQIQTRVVAWEEAVAMCLDGRIDDAKTIAGLLLVDALRRA